MDFRVPKFCDLYSNLGKTPLLRTDLAHSVSATRVYSTERILTEQFQFVRFTIWIHKFKQKHYRQDFDSAIEFWRNFVCEPNKWVFSFRNTQLWRENEYPANEYPVIGWRRASHSFERCRFFIVSLSNSRITLSRPIILVLLYNGWFKYFTSMFSRR